MTALIKSITRENVDEIHRDIYYNASMDTREYRATIKTDNCWIKTFFARSEMEGKQMARSFFQQAYAEGLEALKKYSEEEINAFSVDANITIQFT